MNKNEELKIGNLIFKSKSEVNEYTKSIFLKIKMDDYCERLNKESGIIRKCTKEYEYLDELIKNHPEYEEKIDIGIDYLYICKNTIGNYYLNIKRLDGTETNIGWNMNQWKNVWKDKTKLNVIMRNNIKNSLMEYKKKKIESGVEIKCNKCDLIVDSFHVDHVYPFVKIRDDFLRNNDKIPTCFEKINGILSFKKSDNEFKEEWINYHNKNSKYQILCEKCNLIKGSKYVAGDDDLKRKIIDDINKYIINKHKIFIKSIEDKTWVSIKSAIDKYKEELKIVQDGSKGTTNDYILEQLKKYYIEILSMKKEKNKWKCSNEKLEKLDFNKMKNISKT